VAGVVISVSFWQPLLFGPDIDIYHLTKKLLN